MALQSLAASGVLHHDRNLKDMMMMGGDGDMMMGGDGEMMGDSPWDDLFDEDTMDKIEQCGVDLDTLMDDYLGFVMGVAMNDDPTNLVIDLLNQLAEDGEEECTEQQMSQLLNAGEDYYKCAGTNDAVTQSTRIDV